jgi:hypothetical protein
MIVPQYWAEGRIREQMGGRQLTMPPFGWLEASWADVQNNAGRRTRGAFAQP